MIQWSRQVGAEEVGLEVRASSDAAIRLYRRAGFAPYGLRPGYYTDPWEDGLLMRLALASPRGTVS